MNQSDLCPTEVLDDRALGKWGFSLVQNKKKKTYPKISVIRWYFYLSLCCDLEKGDFHWRWLYAAGSVSDTNVGKKLTSVIVGIDNPVGFPCL